MWTDTATLSRAIGPDKRILEANGRKNWPSRVHRASADHPVTSEQYASSHHREKDPSDAAFERE